MGLDLEELKRLHDEAYTHSQVTRQGRADDLVFYYLTQWDDNVLNESQLAYRGQFDVLRKAGRKIMADLAENPVQVDFEPVDEEREDSGEILDGLYRSDDNKNTSIEAYGNARNESIVCGMGAWELSHEYVTMRNGDERQVITRTPIREANNTVYYDPGSMLTDRSDSDYCSVLMAYSPDGYKKLVKEMTGEELPDGWMDSFKHPEQSYSFPWIRGASKRVYVARFYHREKVKEKLLTMTSPFGEQIVIKEKALLPVIDDMMDAGYEIVAEKEVMMWEVTRYIASGAQIIAKNIVAGEHIPVIPVYGEIAMVEGSWHWEGITRLAKDPQRLRNFQLSYLADIVSRSPRRKPIFLKEQLAGLEPMYQETGSENNFPYLLQNRMAGGKELPLGPVGEMPEQPLPSALIQAIPLIKDAIADVADPGMPQDVADPDISGKAVLALQRRVDMQSMVYQENLKHAKRRDGEVYASMASVIYDVPRTVRVTRPDGARASVRLMDTIIDQETGDIVTINDISNIEYSVYSKIGPSYSSHRDQTLERLSGMLQGLEPGPMRDGIILKILTLMDGVDFDDIRDYAKRQLLLTGFRQPETPEEEQLIQEAAEQNQEPSADMVLAQAEMLKGRADIMREQREMEKLKVNAMNEGVKRDIDTFKAQTDRMDTQIDAQEAGANIDLKRIDAFGKKIDNTEKIIKLQDFKTMSDDELFQVAMRG